MYLPTNFLIRASQISEKKKVKERPEIGQFFGFDHVTFWVGNAKQAAAYYCTHLGFDYLAYSGPETGIKDFASHAISNGHVIFVFQSAVSPEAPPEYLDFIAKHGDGVRNLAFKVDDVRSIFDKAIQRGAKALLEPVVPEDSTAPIFATIQSPGALTLTFVQRPEVNDGVFLPGYV